MQNLLGRFELKMKLATGGTAEVHLAHQHGDGGFVRPVVVKRLHRHLASDPSTVRLFQNEAHLLSLFTTPGVPRVYDLRQDGDSWYSVVEFFRGPTLGSLLRAEQVSGERMPLNLAVGIIAELAATLDIVHSQRDELSGDALGVVHGDLSPENVIVSRQGAVALVDFGLATTRSQRFELDLGMRGTIGYMSPETVSRGEAIDARSDLFVLGVLLYQVSTGERPFQGDRMEFMEAVRSYMPPPPSSLRPGFPRTLEQIILKALQKDRHERFPSARAFRRAIDDFVRTEGLAWDARMLRDYCEALYPAANDRLPAMSPVASFPADGAGDSPEVLSRAERMQLLADLEALVPNSVMPSRAASIVAAARPIAFEDRAESAQIDRALLSMDPVSSPPEPEAAEHSNPSSLADMSVDSLPWVDVADVAVAGRVDSLALQRADEFLLDPGRATSPGEEAKPGLHEAPTTPPPPMHSVHVKESIPRQVMPGETTDWATTSPPIAESRARSVAMKPPVLPDKRGAASEVITAPPSAAARSLSHSDKTLPPYRRAATEEVAHEVGESVIPLDGREGSFQTIRPELAESITPPVPISVLTIKEATEARISVVPEPTSSVRSPKKPMERLPGFYIYVADDD